MIEEFYVDLPNLSGSAIKVYLVLSRYKTEHGENWITASYESIKSYSGLGSYTSIRKAILEIASSGWLLDYEKGGYDILNGKRVNRSTKFKLSNKRLSPEDIQEVIKKIV